MSGKPPAPDHQFDKDLLVIFGVRLLEVSLICILDYISLDPYAASCVGKGGGIDAPLGGASSEVGVPSAILAV